MNSFHKSTVENRNWTPKCYNYSIFHWLRSSQLYRDIYVQKDLTYRQRMDIIARRASRRGDTNNGAPSSSQSQAIQGRARSQDSHTNVGLELQRGGVVSVQTQPRGRGAPRAVATSREGSSGVSVLQESSLDSLVGFSSEGGSGSRRGRRYQGGRGLRGRSVSRGGRGSRVGHVSRGSTGSRGEGVVLGVELAILVLQVFLRFAGTQIYIR